MATVFSNFAAPSVEAQAMKRQLSPVLMNNIVQDIIQSNGKGVTEEFSMDTNALEIRVVREKPLTQNARSFGGATDIGLFSSQTPEQPTSAEYGIKVENVYDTPIDIPSNMTDMFPLEVVNKTLMNLSQAVAKNVNAHTTATQLTSYFNNGGTGTVYEVGVDDFLDSFLTASAVLDDGDVTNGVDVFPHEGRIAVIRSAGRLALLKGAASVLQIGNFKAQDMLAVGALSPGTTPNFSNSGYIGDIDGINVHFQSGAVWTLGRAYVADVNGAVLASTNATAADLMWAQTYGYIAAAQGTGRAIAFDSVVKTIDSPQGQGIRLQPKYRWGSETWFPLSISPIVTDSWSNTNYITTNKVVAPGSQT